MAVPIEQILQDLAVIMIIASAMTLVFYKLKQPIVIGFIIAGVIRPQTNPKNWLQSSKISRERNTDGVSHRQYLSSPRAWGACTVVVERLHDIFALTRVKHQDYDTC